MAQLGTGTRIWVNSSSEAESDLLTAELFAEVVSIKLPSLEAGKVDVTHMTSVDYREYLTKELLDSGEMEVECNFNPAIDPTDYTGTGHTFHIIFPSATATHVAWSFVGGLAKYDATIPLEDKMTVNVTLTVEGEITHDLAWTD